MLLAVIVKVDPFSLTKSLRNGYLEMAVSIVANNAPRRTTQARMDFPRDANKRHQGYHGYIWNYLLCSVQKSPV